VTTYRVLYTETFHEELDAQLAYLAEQGAPESRVSGWLSELLELVDSLAESPRRYPVAGPESVARGVEIRRVPFGGYLAFYLVDDAHQEVQLLGFRHGARQRGTE
jgi:plasmid stabilization system protein ParE